VLNTFSCVFFTARRFFVVSLQAPQYLGMGRRLMDCAERFQRVRQIAGQFDARCASNFCVAPWFSLEHFLCRFVASFFPACGALSEYVIRRPPRALEVTRQTPIRLPD